MTGDEAGPGAFYEIKYRDPLGNIFDITTNGWAGAVKEGVPAEPQAKAEARNRTRYPATAPPSIGMTAPVM